MLATEEHFTGKKGQALQVHTHGKVGPRRIVSATCGAPESFMPMSITMKAMNRPESAQPAMVMARGLAGFTLSLDMGDLLPRRL